MGRNLSPMVERELANLDKDTDSHKSAMKTLKSYVKGLDSKAIPQFLAQLSETKETGSSPGEYTISLYEVLARVHGVNIVPQIDDIMASIIKTLSSSAGSFALHQACSKVVPSIARYGIDLTTTEDNKRRIIHSLCKPLSDSLLGSQESLSSGAALCLKALVDSDNWRFASDEMVNEVCLRVAGTLEDKPKQTNSHIGLVMALAKHNALVVEAYARLLVLSGLRILSAGIVEGNSQKRLSAIQMVNFLMRCLDPRSIFSELALIIKEMEKCQSDQMAYVKGAAFEALQTARKIAIEKGLIFGKDVASATGLNFCQRDIIQRRSLWNMGDRSPASVSPESQTLDSIEYGSFADSPISAEQVSCYLEHNHRSANRRLWRHEHGQVDTSLKDHLFSEMDCGKSVSSILCNNSWVDKVNGNGREYIDGFEGFLQGSSGDIGLRSATVSPQRSHSQINADNIKIFTTPRKLIRSLQDPEDVSSDFSSDRQTMRFQDLSSCKYESHPAANSYDLNGFSQDVKFEAKGEEKLAGFVEQFKGGPESVSSTGDVDLEDFQEVVVDPENNMEGLNSCTKKAIRKTTAFNLVCALFFMLVAVLASLAWIDDDQEEGLHLVPT